MHNPIDFKRLFYGVIDVWRKGDGQDLQWQVGDIPIIKSEAGTACIFRGKTHKLF